MRRVDANAVPLPLDGGPADKWDVERASASPKAVCAATPIARVRVKRHEPIDADLHTLQMWFSTVIMHPTSERAGVRAATASDLLPTHRPTDLERIVTRGPQWSALQRLHVYHYAYHARLAECLSDDFPSLVYALGEKAFNRLAKHVIAARPSQTPDLNQYGARLVEHVAARPRACRHQAFIHELAQLEWAMVDVLHAATAPVLPIAELQKIPLEAWAKVRFTPSPTAQLLTFRYPVNAFLQAWREDRKPSIPRPQPSATAVYRQGYSVWRMDLTPPMAAILSALWAGKTLGQALETLHITTPADQQQAVANKVMTWFQAWVQGGFFAGLRLRSSRRLSST